MKDEIFHTLLQHAWQTLHQSAAAIKEKYKQHPIWSIEYSEPDTHEHVLKIRFDTHMATLYISFVNGNLSDACFLFLDSTQDEDLLIDHLIDWANYDFRKSSFSLPSCTLKIKQTNSKTCFYLSPKPNEY